MSADYLRKNMEMITVTVTSINGVLFEPHKMSVKSDAIASVREYSEREGANDSNSEICKIGDPTVYGVIETREEVLADIASAIRAFPSNIQVTVKSRT